MRREGGSRPSEGGDMAWLTVAFLALADIEVLDSRDFTRASQVAAVTATVRVVNAATGFEASGVVVGRSGPLVYVLTAAHAAEGARTLEVSTFSAKSYPKPERTHTSATVLARDRAADLAVLRFSSPNPPA